MNALQVVLLRAIRAALWVPGAAFWWAAHWRSRLDTKLELLRQATEEGGRS